jgi:hypothetical protein
VSLFQFELDVIFIFLTRSLPFASSENQHTSMNPTSEADVQPGIPPSNEAAIDSEHTSLELDSNLVSDPGIVYIKTSSPCSPCNGYMLTFPPGKSPNANYPFMLHDSKPLPWDYEYRNGIMVLRARTCPGKVTVTTSCGPCNALKTNTILIGIQDRICDGIHENAPFAYHGLGGLTEVARRKSSTIDRLRLRHLNDARKLVGQEGTLEHHKQMLLALASKQIPRVDRVLRAGFRRHVGIHSMLKMVKKAANGTYHPKSFDEQDDLQALLMLRLGGSRVANITHRIFGTPAAATVRRRPTVPLLLPSPSTPKLTEIQQNIESCFSNLLGAPGMAKNLFHAVVMFDEIATEKCPRWDDKTNKFLGICREHGSKTSLSFNSKEDVETLVHDLKCGDVHLSIEVHFLHVYDLPCWYRSSITYNFLTYYRQLLAQLEF